MTDYAKPIIYLPDDFGIMDYYQRAARNTAIYNADDEVTYPLFGLIGEVGEFANKYKKVLRDNAEFSRDDMASELGDILWYLAVLVDDCQLNLSYVAAMNLNKLEARKHKGTLGGSGDNR